MHQMRLAILFISLLLPLLAHAQSPDPTAPQYAELNRKLDDLTRQKDYPRAVDLLKAELARQKDNPVYYLKLAQLYSFRTGDYASALFCYQKALDLYPGYYLEDEMVATYLKSGEMPAEPLKKLLQSYHDKGGMGDLYEEFNRNTLAGLDSNAILFTNGDNDTFPALYWQFVNNFRRDVTVVNLSLLNAAPFIKYLKNGPPKIPMRYSNETIDSRLRQGDSAALAFRAWPPDDSSNIVRLTRPGGGEIVWKIPATIHVSTGAADTGSAPNCLRVQDCAMLDIVRTTGWSRPLYFTLTVSNLNLLGLNEHLTIEGLAFRLSPRESSRLDAPRVAQNLLTVYEYAACRNFPSIRHQTFDPWYDGPHVPAIDNEKKMVMNYRSLFLQLAYYYSQQNDSGAVNYDSSAAAAVTLPQFQQFSSRDRVKYLLDKMEEAVPERIFPLPEELKKQILRMRYTSG
jgi:tetratricopeptide (TPR) repeat protein